MNEDSINKLGNKPLQPLLKEVESVQDLPSLTSYLAEMGRNDNGGKKTPSLQPFRSLRAAP